jgi:hypothetical protein
MLKMVVEGCVLGKLRYSLPFLPPSGQSAWAALESLLGYAARLIRKDWERKPGELAFARTGAEVAALAGLPMPRQLADDVGVLHVYAGLFQGRLSGRWMVVDDAGPRTRSQALHPLRLKPPPLPLSSFAHLAPSRLVHLWNRLQWSASPLPPQDLLRSLPAFKRVLPCLLAPT